MNIDMKSIPPPLAPARSVTTTASPFRIPPNTEIRSMSSVMINLGMVSVKILVSVIT